MAIRNILKQEAPELRKISRKVELFDKRLGILIDDMIETLAKADGAGIAAPQVGVLKRVFVIVKDGAYMEFVNPEILETKGTQSYIEGCLSVPGINGMTHRPDYVKIKAADRRGVPFVYEVSGPKSVVLSHENDHLNGILFIDHAHILSQEELEEMFRKEDDEEEENL